MEQHLAAKRNASRFSNLSLKVSYVARALGLIRRATGWWMIAWGSLLFVQGLLPAATVYLTKILVDSLSAALGNGVSWESVQPVLVPAVMMGSILLATEVIRGFISWIHTAQSELVHDYTKSLIHEKAAEVDLEFFEIPEQSDRMSRANSEAASRSLSLLQNFGSLVQHTLTITAVAALLLAYTFWVPLLLFVSTLPALWVVLRHNILHHEWWRGTTQDRRWAEYFDNVLTHPFPAAEVRLFELAPFFQDAYVKLRVVLRKSRLRLLRNQNIAQLGASLSALVVTAGTLAWMAGQALRGLATLGDLALFYQAFTQGQNLMRSLLSSVGQLYSDTLFLEHLFTVLDLQPGLKNPEKPVAAPKNLEKGIRFSNVDFCYPGSSHLALNNFDFFVPAGKTVALVGPNGAGKTTVTKLLCRFYDPKAGHIEIDGVDIRTLDIHELRRLCTVLFQLPIRYVATVERNIALGDLNIAPERAQVQRAAVGGGADSFITQLPQGYDTLLGKQFTGGIELSGGQWQRVSLARAFFRDSPIVILDEPTSFMDSWAETRWLDRFKTLVKGRTAIIVTHRFTTAMRADIICVVEKGSVVEKGTHHELLERDGLYAASWRAQMQAEEQVEVEPE